MAKSGKAYKKLGKSLSVGSWCLTLNNYSEEDVALLKQHIEGSNCKFAIFGKEGGKENKTPHIQGFVHYKTRYSLNGLKRILGPRWHLEAARGTDEENERYCTKEGDELLRVGSPVVGKQRDSGSEAKSERCLQAAEILSKGGDISSVFASGPDTYCEYIRNQRAINEHARSIEDARAKQLLAQTMGASRLRMWQKDLVEELLEEPNDRTIIWYCDVFGNTGKTWFSKLCIGKLNCIRFENGRSVDIKYAYSGQRVVIFDLTRTQQDHFNYEVLETIKNGVMFSSKYDSRMKVFTAPHVVVFANWPPDNGKLSNDRWDIRTTMNLTDSELTFIGCEVNKAGKLMVERATEGEEVHYSDDFVIDDDIFDM